MIRSVLWRGLSEENGSWKTTWTSLRNLASAAPAPCSTSSPSKVKFPALGSISFTTIRAIVDLPLPDSPTMARVSRSPTSKLASSTQDLKFEKRIIGIEHVSDFNAPTAGLLIYRYGLHGVGMANFGAPSTIDMTRRDVIEWALWLREDNTSVAFTKRLPATLDLQLLPGTVTRTEQSKALLTTPALVASSKGGVALSLLVPRSDVDLLQIALEHELFMSLRHRRGLIYGVETFTTPVDGEVSELVFVLDPERDHIDTTVRVVSETLEGIAAAGFSQAAVDRARLHGSARAQRTFAGHDYLDRLAEDALHGWPTRSPEQMDDDATAVTSGSLTETLLGVAASVIIAYDEDVSLSKKTLRSLPVPVTRFTPWQRDEDHFSRATVLAAAWSSWTTGGGVSSFRPRIGSG